MALTREPGAAVFIEVLDRILDKGIVIDGWIRVNLVGIDLLTVEARVVIASLETYLNYADTLALTRLVSTPPITIFGEHEHDDQATELSTRSRQFAAKAGF